jgi:hypothetical protein
LLKEFRDYAPIGMWNSGILGYGKMVKWVIGKIHIDWEVHHINK